MINTDNLNEARKQIQKAIKERMPVIVKAQTNEFNRKFFENKDVDMIVGLEFNRIDYMKQRDSGLNEVLCKLAEKNDIKIGIDVDKLAGLDKIEKAKVLARIIQNIGLCKRVGCKLVISSDKKYDKQEIMSFFLCLKGSTNQAKIAFSLSRE